MNIGNALIGAALALLLVLATAQDKLGLPGVEKVTTECLYCHVGVVHIMMADRVPTSTYRCITDETQEGDGDSEEAYSINFPTAFFIAHKERLDSNISRICIIGGSAIRTEFGKPDYIVIPQNTGIHFVANLSNRERHLAQTGSRSVLVVRVTAPSSTQSNSAASLANGTFGIGGQQNSMASQYSSCSSGKLSFVPASGYPDKVTNGVIDIILPTTVNNTSCFDLVDSMKSLVKASLGFDERIFSHVMFCMPYGTTWNAGGSKNWLVFAGRPSVTGLGYSSYYNNDACASLSAKMQGIGINLGLQNSKENAYEDKSCMMGDSYYETESPLMCFNGHKNYVLGWYADKQITINPATGGAWSGKLVGFVDYAKASPISRNEYVLIIVDQLYIQYNLATGFNFQVKDKANLVTIVTAPNSTSESSLLSALTANQSTVIDLYTIDVCQMVAETSKEPKYMILSIHLNTQSSTCNKDNQSTSKPTTQPTNFPTIQPTSKLTKQPTVFPTIKATSKPTSQPTSFPTTQPTSKPSTKPTSFSTIKPTSKPSTKPTSSPTIQPTSKPTTKSTSFSTIKPTSKPSTKPTSSPTIQPTSKPTTQPTSFPTIQPTSKPTIQPTSKPTIQPTSFPTIQPTNKPTTQPTSFPTILPTSEPTTLPTSFPTNQPTSEPTIQPTSLFSEAPVTSAVVLFGQTFPADTTKKLDLSWQGYGGTISSVLGKLTSLTFLDLSFNTFTGALPTEIGLLKNLTNLNLGYNQFKGKLPTEIGHLKYLTSLPFSFNTFTGALPTEIGLLKNLTQIKLTSNAFTGTLPTEIGLLTSLQSLFFDVNSFTGTLPTEIGLLKSLIGLSLGKDSFTGTLPTEIGRLTSLRWLDLYNNAVTGTLPTEIGLLTSLHTLYLSNNTFTGTLPTKVGLLKNLSYLNLGYNHFKGNLPTEIGHLKRLTSLTFSFNTFTGTLPTQIGLLTSLKYLYLNDNTFNEEPPTDHWNLTSLVDLSY